MLSLAFRLESVKKSVTQHLRHTTLFDSSKKPFSILQWSVKLNEKLIMQVGFFSQKKVKQKMR